MTKAAEPAPDGRITHDTTPLALAGFVSNDAWT